MQENPQLAKQLYTPEESVDQAMSFASPEYWESRVYLGVDEVKFKRSLSSEANQCSGRVRPGLGVPLQRQRVLLPFGVA
jgi:hypothetical protein